MSYTWNGVVQQRANAYTDHHLVYSHRTGESLKDVVQLRDDEIYSPPPGGNLVDQLVYRRKFIERRIGQLLTENRSSKQPGAYIVGDLGHEFAVSHTSFRGPKCSYTEELGSGIAEWINPAPRQYLIRLDGGFVGASVSYVGDPVGFFSSRVGSPHSVWMNSGSQGLSESALNSEATSHINNMSPFQRSGGIFATLIELLRGDVPGLLKSLRSHMDLITAMRASGIKSASQALGSEYLNVVFGWTPILKDVQAAVDVLTSIDQLLFPEESTRRSFKRTVNANSRSHEIAGGAELGIVPLVRPGTSFNDANAEVGSYAGSSSNDWRGFDTLGISWNESVWTSARFATGATPSATNNGHLDRAIQLLGLEITPELIWELTPWSWLIDWFTNVGTVIENMSALGLSNTILNYAYSTFRRETLLTVDADPKDNLTGRYPIRKKFPNGHGFMVKIDQKVRIAASPFGFGIAGNSLQAGQLAILTALGLARAR
jgi:hypothetical protein